MESNDTLLTATQTDIHIRDIGEFIFSGTIGDNPDIGSADDVDLFELSVLEEDGVFFDINASEMGSSLDSILRVFDADGNELAVIDGATDLDSFITFRPPATGNYFVGVSGVSNFDYNPTVAGSTSNSGSIGDYELVITTFNDISGDENSNLLNGTTNDDFIRGFDGDDVIRSFAGRDSLNGGGGNDTLTSELDSDRLFGGDSNDLLDAGGGDDTLNGGNGNDRLLGINGNDLLQGGEGRDTLEGGSRDDTLFGNGSNDTLRGDNGSDLLYGGTGRDRLTGSTGNDTLYGNSGNDNLDGNNDSDILYGGTGRDRLSGSAGDDTLWGNAGNDNLDGGLNNDLLLGGTQQDSLNGGTGQDTLIGGAGNDVLVGGTGQDRFQFNSINDGDDTIMDFEVGLDTIDLSSILLASRFESATPFADYIQLIQLGSDTQVQLDRNGDNGGDLLTTIAIMENVVTTQLDSSSFLL